MHTDPLGKKFAISEKSTSNKFNPNEAKRRKRVPQTRKRNSEVAEKAIPHTACKKVNSGADRIRVSGERTGRWNQQSDRWRCYEKTP